MGHKAGIPASKLGLWPGVWDLKGGGGVEEGEEGGEISHMCKG